MPDFTDTTTFLRAYPPAEPEGDAALYLVFRRGELLVARVSSGISLPRGGRDLLGSLPTDDAPLYVGALGGLPCLACELPAEASLPDGWRPLGLRALYGQLPEPDYALAGYAAQLLHFHRTCRFCSACAAPLEAGTGDWGRRCPACGHTAYPTVSPAILVLVHDGADHALLVRKPGWGRRYSIVAGFVEPGESLEECVRREVAEEVGVRVDVPVYVGSQPWPYPSQLMIGFRARYRDGDIALDEKELDDALWFTPDTLPELPPPLSLSRQIIDGWVRERRG